MQYTFNQLLKNVLFKHLNWPGDYKLNLFLLTSSHFYWALHLLKCVKWQIAWHKSNPFHKINFLQSTHRLRLDGDPIFAGSSDQHVEYIL